MGFAGPGIRFAAFMFCVEAYYRSVVTMLASAFFGTLSLAFWHLDWKRRRDARRDSDSGN